MPTGTAAASIPRVLPARSPTASSGTIKTPLAQAERALPYGKTSLLHSLTASSSNGRTVAPMIWEAPPTWMVPLPTMTRSLSPPLTQRPPPPPQATCTSSGTHPLLMQVTTQPTALPQTSMTTPVLSTAIMILQPRSIWAPMNSLQTPLIILSSRMPTPALALFATSLPMRFQERP